MKTNLNVKCIIILSGNESITFVISLGGANACALLKFLQKNDDAQDLKMALVASNGAWVQPENYYGVTHAHISELKLMTDTIGGQCEPWSKLEVTDVTDLSPDSNSMKLSNGK